MSRTCGTRGVERRKKATPITPREWLLDVSLKKQIDLPQFFLKRNYAKEYAADFKQDLLVKFVLSGQQRGPEVQLPVSKGQNRQNEQTGKISWKHKLCISGQVRQSLPRVCWVRTVEATGPRKLTVKLHTQQQHGQHAQQHKKQQGRQPPSPGQPRAPVPHQQHAGGPSHTQQQSAQIRPQPTSSTILASPARQAAAKLRSAATSRARSSTTTQPLAPRTTLSEVELAAKRLRTAAGRGETAAAAGAAAGNGRDGAAAAAEPADRAGHCADSGPQRRQTAAAGVASRGGSSSEWQSVKQVLDASSTSLAVPGNIAELLQSQQKQQQHTRVQVQLLFRLQQSAQVHAAAAPAAAGTAGKKAPASAQHQQNQETSSWLPCVLVAKLGKAVAGSQAASGYQVSGTALQQQLRQHKGWSVVAAQLVGASKLRYRLQEQSTAQHQRQHQHAAPENALQHEQQRQEIAAVYPALAARKRLFCPPAADGPAPETGPKQQRRHICSTDSRELPPVRSSIQQRSSDHTSAQARSSGVVTVQHKTASPQQQHRQQRQHHVSVQPPIVQPLHQPPPPPQPPQQQQQQTKQQTPGCSTETKVRPPPRRHSSQQRHQQQQQTKQETLGCNTDPVCDPVLPSPTRHSPRMRHQQQRLQEPPEYIEHPQPVSGEAAGPAVAAKSADRGSPPSISSSSSDFDKSSDEDFVVSDDKDLPPDHYNGYGEVTEDLDDLKVPSFGFSSPVRQQQRLADEQGVSPHLVQLQQQKVSSKQQGSQLLQQQRSQQQQRQASAQMSGVQYGEAPAAGPVAASGTGQQPSAAGGAGANSNTSPGAAAGPPNSGDAGDGADGFGDAGGTGDGDGNDPQDAAAVGSAGSLENITVVSYFVAVNHHAKNAASPKVAVRIPKLLVDQCLPQLAVLDVGGSCQMNIQLLLLAGTVEAHALIDAGPEGVLSMGDTQLGTVRAKTKKVSRGDSTKNQLMYQLEEVTSSYGGELWVLGLSTYAGCTGLRVMLSSHNPGKTGPHSKDRVMAVTADGRVVSATTGVEMTAVVVEQGPVAAEPSGLSSAPLPAVAATTVAGADSMGGDIATGGDDAVPFMTMGQKLEQGRSLSLPRKFVQRFMPNIWSLERGGSSQVLDVTLALLPPGVSAATPDSQPVSTQHVKGQVTRNSLDRLFLGGPEYLQCGLIRGGQLYAAGVLKLSGTALQLFVSDSRPLGKHEALTSMTASMELESAAAVAAAVDADPAVGDDDEKLGDLPGIDVDPDAAAAAAEAAQQEEAEALVVEVVPAAAGETTGGSATLFPVTQSLYDGGMRRPPRLPNSFLLQHFREVKEQAGNTYKKGWPLELQLVLLPSKAADISPESQPLAVVNVSGSRVVTWRHSTSEALDKAELKGLTKLEILAEWGALNKLDSLHLVGLRPLGLNRVQLLFSQELHPGAKASQSVASAEGRRHRREAAAPSVKSPPVLKPGEARKPMAGRRLSRDGSRTARPGQLQQQGSNAEAALKPSGSIISKHEQRQQQLAAAGVIDVAVEGLRPLSGQAPLVLGSGGLPAQSGGTNSNDSRRSKQDQISPAAAPSPGAVTSSRRDQKPQQQQQQRLQSRLGSGSAPQMVCPWTHDLAQYASQQAHPVCVSEVSGSLNQELAELALVQEAAPASDVDMQDANNQQQQQQQQQHSGCDVTQLDAPEAGAAAAAAIALPEPTYINNVPIRSSRKTGYYTAKLRWIQLDIDSLWAAAVPLKLLNGDAHRVKVQFVQDGVVVAGPVVCCITAFSANTANPNKHPNGYVRLHHSCTLDDQQHTLDALIQQYDGYQINALSALSQPRSSDASSNGADERPMDLLGLHIVPPEVATEVTAATAAEHTAQQVAAAPASLPQQQGVHVSAREPAAAAAAAAAAAPEQSDLTNGPQQQQQQQLLGHSSASGGIPCTQIDSQLGLQRQQQQQQQHSHPSAASHQHSGTGGLQQQQLQQPRQHVPNTEQLAAAVRHEECESKPQLLPVKQEADVHNVDIQYPRHGMPPLQPQQLQQQNVTQVAEFHSPFIAAAAGAIDVAPMPPLQPQQQKQESAQPHTGPLHGAGASAAAAAGGSVGGPVSSHGGGTSTAGGSPSQPQQVTQPDQESELQLPDATEFTEGVWEALIASSSKLADMEEITLDDAADFQEMLTDWLPQDGVVPAEATAFMRKHYKLYARNLKRNVKMAATILKRAVDAFKKSQA